MLAILQVSRQSSKLYSYVCECHFVFYSIFDMIMTDIASIYRVADPPFDRDRTLSGGSIFRYF